jgi:hypothetical protein
MFCGTTGFKNHYSYNKTENAFSPLPARTKASNAHMTACLPLQYCIVQTTRLPEISTAALQSS